MTQPAEATPQVGGPGSGRGDVAPLVETKPCVGVLLVHGAGDHGVGATLVEFGEPLVSWLDGWLAHAEPSPTSDTDRARVGATQILVREADSGAPAHARVTARSRHDDAPHSWLLAEARWDEAFTAPAFGQVLRWAIGVVPWTLLTQFLGPLARQRTFVEANPWSILGFLWRVIVAAATALVAAAIIQVFALAILVLSLIPLTAVRDLVSRLQRFASTAVGDLYMVLASPIQGAALTSAVQRDIDWLRAQGCERIAVVAHSQGGYVAYQALADPWHRNVELFITFGSGLIRLVESQRARRSGVLVTALIGTVGALVALRFLPIAILGEAGVWEKRQASGLAFFVGFLVSMLLVGVLWRYLRETFPVRDLPNRIRWYDFLTKEDPVMNRHRTGLLPGRVRIVRTQNRGSVIADHGSYWLNSDEFVPQVALHLARLDPDLRLLRAGPRPTWIENGRHLRRSIEQRHSRVAALRLRGALLVAATLALILARSDQLAAVGRPVGAWFQALPDFLVDWVPEIIRSVLPIDGLEEVLLGAAVIVVISALAARIGSALWESWGRADTTDQWAGRNPAVMDRAAIAFHSWTILHLIVLGLVALVGPAPLVDGLGYVAREQDRIVQAWARYWPWSVAVAAVVAIWLIRRRGRPYRLAAPAWLVAGTLLAIAIEFGIAYRFPGETPALTAIPWAIVIALGSLAAGWVGWPLLRRAIVVLAAIGERQRGEKREAAHPASAIDYLGMIGAVIAFLTVPMVLLARSASLVKADAFWVFTALLALIGLLLGIMTAANSRGMTFPRRGPLDRDLVIAPASPPSMRIVGLVAALVSWLTLVAAIALLARELRLLS